MKLLSVETNEILSNRSFALFFVSDHLRHNAMWILKFGTIWLIWDLTASGFYLGLLAAVELIPALILFYPAGLIADRFDRFSVVFVAQLLVGLVTVALAFFAYSGASADLIVGLYALIGIAMGIMYPSSYTLTTSIVRKDQYPGAISLNSLNYNVTALIGPSLATIAIVSVGYTLVFVVAAAFIGIYTMALPIVARGASRTDRQVVTQSKFPGGMWNLFRSDRRIEIAFLILVVTALFLRPILEQFPKTFETISQTSGQASIGILTIVIGSANCLAGFALVLLQRNIGFQTLAVALAGTTGGFALMALSDGLVVFSAGLGLAAFSLAVSRTVVLSIFHVNVADAARGRLMSIYIAALSGSAGLGSLVVGVLGSNQWWWYGAGLVCCLAAIPFAFWQDLGLKDSSRHLTASTNEKTQTARADTLP